MAIFNAHTGSWGTPDLGVTEWIQRTFAPKKAYANSGGSNLLGSQPAQSPSYNPQPGVDYSPAPQYTSGGGSVLGSSSSGGSSGGTSTGTTSTSNFEQQIQSPDQGTPDGGPSELDLINSQFSDFSNFLNDQQGLAQQRFDTTQSNITTERDQAVSEAEGQRGIRDQELSNKAETGRQNERLNLQKVRQLLQDLEQRNAARVAVTGGGGSVSEALADRFARTAQQNVGGVLQEGQRFQNDVNIEKEKVAQFYDNAVQKIKNTAQEQIDQARISLNENLSAIEGDRRASAQAKNSARYDAWRSYYDNVNRAKLQAANFKMQYDLWAQQKSAELAGAQSYQVGDIAGQDFSAYQNPANYQYSSGGVGAQPNYQAYAPTYFNRAKQADDEDQNAIV